MTYIIGILLTMNVKSFNRMSNIDSKLAVFSIGGLQRWG